MIYFLKNSQIAFQSSCPISYSSWQLKSQLYVLLSSLTFATDFAVVTSPVDVAGSFWLWLETRNFWKGWRFLFYVSRCWEFQNWGAMPGDGLLECHLVQEAEGEGQEIMCNNTSVELPASSPFIIRITHSWKWGPATRTPPIRFHQSILTRGGER